jgi:phosphate-selective porin OprO/OprP
VAARIGRLSLDEDRFADFADPATAARRGTSWGVGLNWHLNKNLKVNLDFEHTWFSGGTAAVLNRQGEDVILTRVQVAF